MLDIRTAIDDDVHALVRLINLAFVPVEQHFVEGDRTSPEGVRSLLAKGCFLLTGDPIRACIYVELRGERGYFGLLSVDPSHQRQNLGRRLVSAAEDRCRLAGCTVMDLQVVNLRTELIPLYARLGYQERGTAPFPPAARLKQPCHFVLMSKPLA